MSTNEVRSNDAARNAAVAGIDMNCYRSSLSPFRMSSARRSFTGTSDGGSTLIAPPAKISAWSSSRHRAPVAQVHFGKNVTSAAPGSAKAFLIVTDIVAARDHLVAAGVEVGEFFHDGPEGRGSGLHPERLSAARAPYSVIPTTTAGTCRRSRPGTHCGDESGATFFRSASDLASALRRAEAAHGEHEKRIGQRDANWPDWYAAYMVAEQSGKE